jgi:glucose/arabinose dehydrogenase/cytochrome c2
VGADRDTLVRKHDLEATMRTKNCRVIVLIGALLTANLVTPRALAVNMDPAAGKRLFREQCLLCHSAEANDDGGARGPSLAGVVGRRAAAAPGFGYSAALRNSGLTWDPPTLVRFLGAPTAVVPGTTMAIAVPAEQDRINLVAYLYTAAEERVPAAEQPAHPAPTGPPDWKQDAPGRMHTVNLSALPPPFDTPSARNFPKLVSRPANAQLAVPPGFHVEVFAAGLQGPRKMLLAANGDLIISETSGGRVSVLHPDAEGTRAASTTVYAEHLDQPFGLAFYPSAADPRWLYVAETHRVIRYPWRIGDTAPRGPPEVVVDGLPSGGHFTRDVAFSTDRRRLYLSVGSGSNVAEDMPKKTPEETAAWAAGHALGATWGSETGRADVLVLDLPAPTLPAVPRIFATGIRNCVSLTVQPATGALWCTTNERDRLGDDLVPDYSTRVAEGDFFGWPWYYLGAHEDPRLKGERPDLAAHVRPPDVPFQAHSAALSLTFYTASAGKSAFPAEYVGDGFAAFHGSWNRTFRTGHKLVRLLMKNGVPTGQYQDFLTGFIVDDGDAWGRPVATVELADGSLLMSDDGGNFIYRISYRH